MKKAIDQIRFEQNKYSKSENSNNKKKTTAKRICEKNGGQGQSIVSEKLDLNEEHSNRYENSPEFSVLNHPQHYMGSKDSNKEYHIRIPRLWFQM